MDSENTESTPKVPEKRSCPDGFHEDISNYVAHEKSYFTAAQKKKHPHWPQTCAQCNSDFWDGKMKLTRVLCAQFCQNAVREDCDCTLGFCPPCFAGRVEKGNNVVVAIASPLKKAMDLHQKRKDVVDQGGRKSVRRRIDVSSKPLPGEVVNKDGQIVAV